jgi:4-amino-4-deoxy-L-arabinose transferase-like glycosyltransferase
MTPRTADAAIAGVLGLSQVACLLLTADDLGYTRDEGFYVAAARSYRRWLELLATEPSSALSAIDRYFVINHEHPALMKLAFSCSHWLFHDQLALLSQPGTAYRLPAMLLAGLAVAVIYLWGRRELGRAAGLLAALAFAFLPRVFFHAHLACFDLPVAALGLVTAYCYARSLSSPRLGWALSTGLCFGLALGTKHNAWFLPVIFGLHLLLVRGRAVAAGLRRGRLAIPRVWLAIVVLGPLVFYLGWPWLWNDPLSRLGEYVEFHLNHEYYNIEFLGQTYHAPPFPRTYAWVMTLATVPLTTLLLFALGAGTALRAAVESARRDGWFCVELSSASATWSLWLIAVVVNYAPWLSGGTPIFGGTKHWIAAYPFLCLLAGLGFRELSAVLIGFARSRPPLHGRAFVERALPVLAGGALLAAPLAITLDSHPFGLSAYTPIAGGAPGAASLGLNRGFWGYTTGALTEYLNRTAPPGARVYLHDTLGVSFDLLRLDARLRSDLRGTLDLAASEMALYHYEPHMSRVESQIWVLYGTVTPAAVATHDGVPVAWVYRRPETNPR